jgi:hypothetical protein
VSVAWFPFGRPSTPRPPRQPTQPTSTPCRLFVLGAYPSALHVAWRVPARAVAQLGLRPRVAALAVDVEPEVFWDGGDAAHQQALVDEWKHMVGFVEGDGDGCDGFAEPAGNGSSGRAVLSDVLEPLGVDPAAVWFTDAITTFHVKYAAGGQRPQQGDRLREVYDPFAQWRGRAPATLPPRPSPAQLVDRAVAEDGERLLAELAHADAPTVVTLGEEARRVLQRLADHAEGPPAQPLRPDTHGLPGRVRVGGVERGWLALTHPGNRSLRWAAARRRFRFDH